MHRILCLLCILLTLTACRPNTKKLPCTVIDHATDEQLISLGLSYEGSGKEAFFDGSNESIQRYMRAYPACCKVSRISWRETAYWLDGTEAEVWLKYPNRSGHPSNPGFNLANVNLGKCGTVRTSHRIAIDENEFNQTSW